MRRLVPIRRGQVIRASYLATLAENQNEQIGAARAPGGTPGAEPGAPVQQALTPGQAANIDPRAVPDPRAQEAAGLTTAEATDTYTEVSRVTSTVRVENPGDPAQYVDVERIDQILFARGDGRTLLLKFNNS